MSIYKIFPIPKPTDLEGTITCRNTLSEEQAFEERVVSLVRSSSTRLLRVSSTLCYTGKDSPATTIELEA